MQVNVKKTTNRVISHKKKERRQKQFLVKVGSCPKRDVKNTSGQTSCISQNQTEFMKLTKAIRSAPVGATKNDKQKFH